MSKADKMQKIWEAAFWDAMGAGKSEDQASAYADKRMNAWKGGK